MVAIERSWIVGRLTLDACLPDQGRIKVHRALDSSTGQRLVVRFLRDADPVAIHALERVSGALLSHPHPVLVPILEVGTHQGRGYWVTPELPLLSVEQMLARGIPTPLPLSLRILAMVGDALEHAHRLGLAHGALRPGNVQLAPDGRVLLTELGFAHWLDGAMWPLGAMSVPPSPPPSADLDALATLNQLLLTRRPSVAPAPPPARPAGLAPVPTLPPAAAAPSVAPLPSAPPPMAAAPAPSVAPPPMAAPAPSLAPPPMAAPSLAPPPMAAPAPAPSLAPPPVASFVPAPPPSLAPAEPAPSAAPAPMPSVPPASTASAAPQPAPPALQEPMTAAAPLPTPEALAPAVSVAPMAPPPPGPAELTLMPALSAPSPRPTPSLPSFVAPAATATPPAPAPVAPPQRPAFAGPPVGLGPEERQPGSDTLPLPAVALRDLALDDDAPAGLYAPSYVLWARRWSQRLQSGLAPALAKLERGARRGWSPRKARALPRGDMSTGEMEWLSADGEEAGEAKQRLGVLAAGAAGLLLISWLAFGGSSTPRPNPFLAPAPVATHRDPPPELPPAPTVRPLPAPTVAAAVSPARPVAKAESPRGSARKGRRR